MSLFREPISLDSTRLKAAGFERLPGRSGEPVAGYWRRHEADGWRTYTEREALGTLTPESDEREGE